MTRSAQGIGPIRIRPGRRSFPTVARLIDRILQNGNAAFAAHEPICRDELRFLDIANPALAAQIEKNALRHMLARALPCSHHNQNQPWQRCDNFRPLVCFLSFLTGNPT